jgi:hypothetical protein
MAIMVDHLPLSTPLSLGTNDCPWSLPLQSLIDCNVSKVRGKLFLHYWCGRRVSKPYKHYLTAVGLIGHITHIPDVQKPE